MNLSNPHHNLFIQADGKLYKILHICQSTEEANAFCAKHSHCGVISEDEHGNIYIATIRAYSLMK